MSGVTSRSSLIRLQTLIKSQRRERDKKMRKMKKTDPKTRLVSIAFIALMLCSIFAGAVSASAENISENQSDNTILNETELYDDFNTLNSSDNHSLSSKIDTLLNDKPVFLFFYTDWCHFCQEQKPIIDDLEQEYADKVAFIRVNAEENPQAMNEFGVTGFPAMFLIVDKNVFGYVYQEFRGFTEKETLEESLDYVVENEGVTEGFENSMVQFGHTEQSDFLISSQGNVVLQYGNPHGLSWEEFFDLYKRAYKAADAHGRPEFKQIADSELNKRLNNEKLKNAIKNLRKGVDDIKKMPLDEDVKKKIELLDKALSGAEIVALLKSNYGPDTVEALSKVLDLCSDLIAVPGVGQIINRYYAPVVDAIADGIRDIDASLAKKNVECMESGLDPLYPGASFGGGWGGCWGKEGEKRLVCGFKFVFGWPPWRDTVNEEICKNGKWVFNKEVKVCEEGCVYNGAAHCKESDEPDVGPGRDKPDDNYDVSTQKIILSDSFDPEVTPKIAVLFKGFPVDTRKLLARFNEPVSFVGISTPPHFLYDYPILIIPTGGLYGLDSLQTFKHNLEEYVKNGGILIVFSQQHGYEYKVLPGGNLSGYGWLEDQSCHYRSVYIDTYHPILSGQDSVTLDVVVDGYFTKWPENSTILLSRTKNGMPAMLMYKYGNGAVIASTIYEDWAYTHYQSTQDGKNLVRDIIAWAKDRTEISEYGKGDTVNISVNVTNVHLPIPEVEYPRYELGDTVNISINVTNYANLTSDKVSFSVFDPDYEINYVNVSVSIPANESKIVNFTYPTTTESKKGAYLLLYSLYAGETVIGGGFGGGFALGVNTTNLSIYKVNFTLIDPDKQIVKQEIVSVYVPPGEIKTVNFTYANPSKLGIWQLKYEIFDYNNTLIDWGMEKFAVSKYAENPEGFVYQGKEITFAVNSESEKYAYGSNGNFTITIWNHGDIAKNVTCWWSFPHNYWAKHDPIYGKPGTTSPGHRSNLYKTLAVPAHGEASFVYSVPLYSYYDRLWADFYEGDYTSYNYLGKASRGFYVFEPSIDIQIETQKEYAVGEDVSVSLNLRNKRSAACNATVIVRVLDPDNNKVFEDTFYANLSAYESLTKTLTFTLPTTSEYGVYLVSVEAYTDGRKIGSGSTYFEVRGYIVKMSFDKPDRAYRIRESMNIELEVKNTGSSPWSSSINISIPALAFEDLKYVSLNPNETKNFNYNLNVPETTPAGKHDVIVTISYDNAVKKYYFVVSDSKLILSAEKTSYNAGDYLGINLTNVGGVDTTYNCSIRFSDSKGFVVYDNSTQGIILAGENKTIGLEIPEQAVDGEYHLFAECKDLNTSEITTLSKSYTISGLKAVLTSVTDKKAYFSDENISTLTNITNLDGEIVNGTLNLKVFSVIPAAPELLLAMSESTNQESNSVLTTRLIEDSIDSVREINIKRVFVWIPQEYLIWEKNITVNVSAFETKDILTNINIPSEMPGVIGKLELIATLYNHINSSQVINQSSRHSFFITDKNTSLTLETDKEVYKPNETITIYGEVKNNAELPDDYNLLIKKDGEEILSANFTLDPGQTYSFTTSTSSETSFILEGSVDGVIVTDFVRVEKPDVNVSIIAPDIVGIRPFEVGVLIENIGNISAELNVSIENNTWNITIPEKEARLITTTMSIKKNTTLNVTISGDVNKTIQKEIICGENTKINITPQPTYLEGIVEIPFTIENIGLLDSEFNATFSIDNQTVSRSFFVPKGQNITDSVSFNLTKGAHTLKYISPFEEVNVTINVLSPPDFVITSIYPADMEFLIGENVTITFEVGNVGGTEGEATIRLLMPDFEDTNRTWIRPGERENISFRFKMPDDLEERRYKGIYEIDGRRGEFYFFVYGANISVNASLDKNLYEENETAIFTLNITNECPLNFSLYARVKLSEYEEVKHFNLTDFKTLKFYVPVHFNGQKLFYGIYMESGRALYLNAMYVHKKEIISLYTDKQVYNAGENVTIFVETTESGILNITAPGFNKSMFLTGSAVIEFELPKELRSGTYYIDYTFDNFSAAYPFDVIGYSARILECNLDKEVYNQSDVIRVNMNVETNKNISGVLKLWIYDPEDNLIKELEIERNFVKGENKINIVSNFSSNLSGIHALVYGIYAHGDLIFLASGAEYFDVKGINAPPIANANGPYAGMEGQTVEFDASASYDPEGMPLTYYWEFGDGETAVTTQPTITHIYAQEGNYTVTLIVNDSVQNSTPSITYALINDTEPKANFTANVTSGFAPLTVQFNDSSVSYDGIIAWKWDFNGDGIIDSNEQNPTHTYDEAGTYTVSLTVCEADGDSDTETKTDYITVTSAADTEPPTIESVTLDTYINIPNSSFHVTVNATDNVGVTSVTADGINLTKKDNIWEGDIYIPPETHEGKYNITIIAEDDAGNFNKTTVYYSVVIPTGGLGVAILPKISSASPGSEMKLDINVVSTENFDDIVHINLTLEGILTDFQANLSWFNWTNKTVMIPIEGEIVLPIAIEIPNGTSSGYKSFGVYVESKRWHSSARDYGAIMVG